MFAGKMNIQDLGLYFVAIIVMFLMYTYPSVLPQHPKAVHQWRQCDGSSITMMYVHNHLNPFHPEVHNRHGQGKTVAEFPIIYYLNACIISVVGAQHKNFVIRGVNLLIFYFGLFYLFKLGLLLLKNRWLAIVPVIFLHSCPIVTYYAASSVPDVPAFSLVIVGIYFLVHYIQSKEAVSFGKALFAVALAGMIKSTILIPYLALCFILAWSFITNNSKYKLSLSKLLLLGLPLAVTLVWVMMAGRYNAAHENITFLLNIKPIWGIDRPFINEISIRIKSSWLPEYNYVPLMWFIFGLGVFFLTYPNKSINILKMGLGILVIGTAAYFYLFFEQFYHHDYYAIELLPMMLAFMFGGLYYFGQEKIDIKIKYVAALAIIVLLVLNVMHTRENMIRRYTVDGQWNAYYDIYPELTPKLRAAGIQFTDKVLVSSDGSPNISLYLLDQLGWTRFPYGLDEEKLQIYMNKGLKYIISREEDLVNRPYLEPYLKNEIIRHKNLVVFQL